MSVWPALNFEALTTDAVAIGVFVAEGFELVAFALEGFAQEESAVFPMLGASFYSQKGSRPAPAQRGHRQSRL